MNIHTLPTLRPFPTRQFPASTSFPRRTIIVSSLNSRRFNSICRIRDRNFQVILCSIHGDGKVLEPEDAALLAATCITRNLPPALTLEHGLDKIKEAVEGLKLKPPNCERGMLRFQVLVPPTAAALNWFCCQHESLEIFPQFFLSKEIENPTCKFLSLNRTYGVFGIGAAFISKECPHSSANYSASQRYLPVDSTRVMAYGFSDINFDATLPYMKHLFIPQIELDEYEGLSILAATLAWSDSCLCTFEQAAQNLDSTLYQVRHHSLPHIEGFCKTFFSSARMKFSMVEDKNLQMVCMSALSLGGSNLSGDPVELIDVSCFHQFCIRLSPTSAIANYMLDHAGGTSHSLKGYANINALWASLIIEECSRLGLTYFCVAPGSRSSPLAIAASAHPLATCIACFDERSLAFHAIGYGRGSRKPAVVITSSGTAVSNLLPAVVEASQDCVPLMLLTADRPPELQDAGANQAINQVNHFGSFVRYFFNLPPPADDVSARMVLTTVDSAFYMAISTPHGPVHINCPFREPLENSPKKWMVSCLKGLNFWISSGGPFTRYVNIQHSFASNTCCHMAEVLKVIQGASQGLLLIGAMHTEEDIWAALLLAKHLSWPMVADILSGLRLRKYLTHFPAMEENFLFIDHLDHLLLSNSVRDWMQADVIVQIGSRITSKRISQMLEDSIPCTYIMVDKHPSRHDPSHLVTHRIQSTITEFTDCLLNVCKPNLSSNWRGFLKTLNMMAAWEISFLIHSEALLTEPYIAHLIPEALVDESAVFVGNSMPIRDADMYACNWGKCTHTNTMMLSSGLPFHSIQVAGNRGASGIDGLLSTAVGFAVGCNKRVLCLIGDISFLHDTNGLALLEQRRWRKPMTIIVINNHGGAIFSLLPIAERTEQSVLDQYFYTSHNISIHHLCVAHGVKHVPVRTKLEFQNALISSQEDDIDSVLEVESCIDANASIHSLRKFTSQAADHASSILSKISVSDSSMHSFIICKICKMGYSLYRIQLYSPPTSASVSYDLGTFYREGFLIALSLDDGSSGFGEVAPLDIHKENMVDVEEQLRFLIHVIEGAKIDYYLPLLKDSFSSWIWNSLGISPSSIFPSVRCGLEMAVLNAMAAREGSTLLNILHPWLNNDDEISGRSLNVQINALIDSAGTPTDVAFLAAQLVKEGFSAIKLKVARRADPLEDATVIQEVRKAVGNCIELRVDANRNWTYDEAFRFGSSVKNCNLQYIEEPVRDEYDIIKFCEETGVPVALDETINSLRENPLEVLSQFAHPGVVAIVIKPSIVGGFEKAAMVARWAHQKGKMAVLSSAFESGLGLSAYIQFCSYLALQNADLCRVMNKEPALPIAHGLGTYSWLKEDVTTNSLPIGPNPHTGFMEASVLDAGQLLQNFPINHDVIIRKFTGETVRNYSVSVVLGRLSFTVNLQEVGPSNDKNLLVFLHGFLGSGEDWIPIMKAISGSSRCIAVDLPGHGGSKQQYQETDEKVEEPNLSIEVVANILNQLFHRLTPEKVTLVGYSMGARIALYMALKCSNKVEGAVIISGSPGLKDAEARKFRIAKDDFLASFLISNGLELFLDTWYAGEMWNSLRDHPRFKQILSNRLQHADVLTLAKVLSDLSTGRQPSLWEELKNCKLPILLIFGEKDKKFKRISQKMYDEISHEPEGRDRSSMVEIPNSGHAVHLENPLPVINAVRKYLTSSQKEFHLITEDAIRR